jgi:hypothetical protein
MGDLRAISVRRIGYKSRVVVVNDALIALVAGAGNERASPPPAPGPSYRNAQHRRARASGANIIGDYRAATGSAAARRDRAA